MNYAVTITAWRRPESLARVLRALKMSGWNHDGPVCLSIDYYDDESCRAIRDCVDYHFPISRSGGIFCQINHPPFGLWEQKNNHFHAYELAFSATRADAILALEDDAVISLDALSLLDWFFHIQRFESVSAAGYLFLSLGNENRYDDVLGKELDVIETPKITSPWAWAFTREAWETKIKPYWQCKQKEPVGWDWSLSAAMAVNQWKGLVPVLSRAKNIGRELGANGGAEWWDQHLKHAAFSDGTFGTDYRLVTVPDMQWHEPWMDSEYDDLVARKQMVTA